MTVGCGAHALKSATRTVMRLQKLMSNARGPLLGTFSIAQVTIHWSPPEHTSPSHDLARRNTSSASRITRHRRRRVDKHGGRRARAPRGQDPHRDQPRLSSPRGDRRPASSGGRSLGPLGRGSQASRLGRGCRGISTQGSLPDRDASDPAFPRVPGAAQSVGRACVFRNFPFLVSAPIDPPILPSPLLPGRTTSWSPSSAPGF